MAIPLFRRLLSLNGSGDEEQFVEVVLLSRNDPDPGLRIFNSIERHGLPASPGPLVVKLGRRFLLADAEDLSQALEVGLPAGEIFPTYFADDEESPSPRFGEAPGSD